MSLVVGAAIVRGGRVLAARRATPPVGGWELPGGKAEPREPAETALVREVAEELTCRIAVTRWLDGEMTIRPGLCLRVALATLVAGEPVPVEHDVVRWLRADQLEEVAWSPADVPFVAQLPPVLGAGPRRAARPH